MFTEGQILYFQPFIFQNGNEPKNKYLIILKNIGDQIIVASLPTRLNNAPSLTNVQHGCVNIDEKLFNCYVFEKNRPVCENGFFFDMQTFIYGNQVLDYLADSLTRNKTLLLNKDYKVEGILTHQEFTDVLNCILNSDSTKRKIRRLLE